MGITNKIKKMKFLAALVAVTAAAKLSEKKAIHNEALVETKAKTHVKSKAQAKARDEINQEMYDAYYATFDGFTAYYEEWGYYPEEYYALSAAYDDWYYGE